MAHVLNAGDIGAKNDLHGVSPWRWLYEIEVPTDPPTRYRLAGDTRDVTFGTSGAGVPLVYARFPIKHGSVRQDNRGGLPTVPLTVGNVSREVQGVVETYNGLIGQSVRIMLVNLGNLAGGVPTFDDRFRILNVECSEKTIQAELGQQNLFDSVFPNKRYMRDHCGHLYKGLLCGYSGGLTSCDKTLNGSNGCVAHSNSERFGAFRGVPPVIGGAL